MPAYAYLLIPPQESLSPVARKRLAAIKEFSDLGSGFRVAALDLEIRGAGNLLGGEQSGHIDAVGFEMYMKLLEETVRELKGEELEDDLRATVNLRVDLKIDDGYMPDMNQRLMVYRKVAAARTETGARRRRSTRLRDRYGPPTDSVLNLAEYGRIRIMADRLGVDTIDREGRLVVIKFRPQAKMDPVRLVKVVQRVAGRRAGAAGFVEAGSGGWTAQLRSPQPSRRLPGPKWQGGSGKARQSKETSAGGRRGQPPARSAGFTKEEILRKPRQRSPGRGGDVLPSRRAARRAGRCLDDSRLKY